MNLTIFNSIRTVKYFLYSTALFLCLLSFSDASAQDAAAGEATFKTNCASCHSPGDKVVAAPGLKGVRERWAGKEELLYTWIKNPNKALATGDAYVVELVNVNKPKFGMMAAQAVTNEQIDDILAYVDAYVPPVVVDSIVDEKVASSEGGIPAYWWGILALFLGVLIWLMAGVRRQMLRTQAVTAGVPYEDMTTFESFKRWVVNNRTFFSIICLLLVAILVVQGWNAATSIGVYQDYAPEQPIAFSHKVHAGTNKIDCQYCHATAEKSKTPLIPSANVCMNCHKHIAEGTMTGTAEIDKIYASIGWDKEERKYSGETDPIKWVKVHDLPDHVYFNHAQHVNVGQIECQTCHGPVEEMDVVKQHAPLTMEWCISCHNETAVKMDGNGYYDEISKRLRDHENGQELLREYLEDGKITAKELGGWECSKCHY